MTRPMTQGISCQVCNKQRAPGEIHKGESRLLKGHTLLICNKCAGEKKEPRGFIIIVARQFGLNRVRDYINNRRYEGEEITEKEVLK